jgi:hypothetical protein
MAESYNLKIKCKNNKYSLRFKIGVNLDKFVTLILERRKYTVL